MADTEFVTEALNTDPNPNRIGEPRHRPADFLVWETSDQFTRKEITVDNSVGTMPILPGTVLIDGNSAFTGIFFGRPALPGVSEKRTVIFKGPTIVKGWKLIWPVVTNAVDGSDAGTDTVAENAAATAALETSLRAAMAAAGISIQ